MLGNILGVFLCFYPRHWMWEIAKAVRFELMSPEQKLEYLRKRLERQRHERHI